MRNSLICCYALQSNLLLCVTVWLLRQDVDVEWFLKQWDGQYNTEWQSHSDMVVRFTTPQALKEALTALGGGIRGVFRVDRG